MEFYIIVTQIFLIKKLPRLWRDKLFLLSLTIRSLNSTRGVKAKLVLLSWTSSAPGQCCSGKTLLSDTRVMSPHCLQFILLCLYSVWELVPGFVMLLMMYSYLTSMTSAVIKGIKHRKNLPLSRMEEEVSLNTCMGKISRVKRCWF